MTYTVSDLIIYPVKSLGGIHLQSSVVEPEGLKYDRRWMLVDDNGCFLTQRKYPKMCLFDMQFHHDGFLVTHAIKTASFYLAADEHINQEVFVNIWDDTVKATIVSGEACEYFSDLMEMQCRLVSMAPGAQRFVDKRYAFNYEITGFSDGFPVLIIGKASLNDVNNKMPEPVPMDRFRPNIVFDGGEAFDEDQWKNISVGSSQLRIAKPCGRCEVILIDHQTGEVGKEPLRTLSQYRDIEHKVLFGQNSLVVKHGEVRVGDEIIIGANINR